MNVNRRLSDQFQLRLPDGMRERLKQAASENDRSMNAEIVARLEESLSGIVANVDAQNSRLAYRLERIERDLARLIMKISKEVSQQKAVMSDPERLSPDRRAFREGIRVFRESETKEYFNLFPHNDERHRHFLRGFFAAARRFYRDDNAPEVLRLRDIIVAERTARHWTTQGDDE